MQRWIAFARLSLIGFGDADQTGGATDNRPRQGARLRNGLVLLDMPHARAEERRLAQAELAFYTGRRESDDCVASNLGREAGQIAVSARNTLGGLTQFSTQFVFRAHQLACKLLILKVRRDVRVV